MPAKQAWGDDGGGNGRYDDNDEGSGGAWDGGKSAGQPPTEGRVVPTAEVVDPSAPEAEKKDAESSSSDSDSEDDGQPGCCSRCCGACGRGIAFVFRALFWLLAYIIGFVFVVVLGSMHISFRIVHAVFNLLAQLRRADLDMVKEFDYERESDASGTEGEEEAADMQAIEDRERFEAEQSGANFGAPGQPGRMGGGAGGSAYRAAEERGSANHSRSGSAAASPKKGGAAADDLNQTTSSAVFVPPPKRTRDEIKEARKTRRAQRADDRRRVRAMLLGQEDPGASDGTNRPVKPPKFASCRCVAQAFVAFIGMMMVSITFLFYSLAQVTLLGLVALLSILVPRTTVAGMQMAKEFEERNDILCRRPWVPPPPPPQESEAQP